MSASSNDPGAKDPRPEAEATAQPLGQSETEANSVDRRQVTLLAGKALPYFAALAAAGAASAGAAAPPAGADRAYLESLLHGSWTPPADLSARRQPPGANADAEFDTAATAFNDSFNPKPGPHTDGNHVDTGFGDRW